MLCILELHSRTRLTTDVIVQITADITLTEPRVTSANCRLLAMLIPNSCVMQEHYIKDVMTSSIGYTISLLPKPCYIGLHPVTCRELTNFTSLQ